MKNTICFGKEFESLLVWFMCALLEDRPPMLPLFCTRQLFPSPCLPRSNTPLGSLRASKRSPTSYYFSMSFFGSAFWRFGLMIFRWLVDAFSMYFRWHFRMKKSSIFERVLEWFSESVRFPGPLIHLTNFEWIAGYGFRILWQVSVIVDKTWSSNLLKTWTIN